MTEKKKKINYREAYEEMMGYVREEIKKRDVVEQDLKAAMNRILQLETDPIRLRLKVVEAKLDSIRTLVEEHGYD